MVGSLWAFGVGFDIEVAEAFRSSVHVTREESHTAAYHATLSRLGKLALSSSVKS